MKAKIVVLCASFLALTACQSTPSEPTGSTACDQSTIQGTIDMFLHESNMHISSFDSLKCAPSWAYAQATVTDEQGVVVQEEYIFELVGENWVLKAPETVCGTPSTDGERPGDALVPAELWSDLCLTSDN
jgi:hypothetical protein